MDLTILPIRDPHTAASKRRLDRLLPWLKGGYYSNFRGGRDEPRYVQWTDDRDPETSIVVGPFPRRFKFTGTLDGSSVEVEMFVDQAFDELGEPYVGMTELHVRGDGTPLDQSQMFSIPVSELVTWGLTGVANFVDTKWTRAQRRGFFDSERIPHNVKRPTVEDVRRFVRPGRPTPEAAREARRAKTRQRHQVVASAYLDAPNGQTRKAVVQALKEHEGEPTAHHRTYKQWSNVAGQAIRAARNAGFIPPSNNGTRPRPTV